MDQTNLRGKRPGLVTSLVAAWILLTARLAGQEAPQAAVPGLTPRLQAILAGGQPPTSVADLRAMQTQQRRVARLVTQATVAVDVLGSQGSGVVIDPRGYVLTAAHVCGRPQRPCLFHLADGTAYEGTTLGVFKSLDAGLMKIEHGVGSDDPYAGPYLAMSTSDDVHPGQWCLATGHHGGYQDGRPPVVRVGRVLKVSPRLIQSDCTLVGGDSGGPLCDFEGRVIGIHSRIGVRRTSNVHVPVKVFRDHWDDLVAGKDGGQSKTPVTTLGIRGGGAPARVSLVVRHSPAAKAGLVAGDEVLAFDHVPIANFLDLQQQVRKHEPGDRVKIEVKRGNERLEFLVELGTG